MTTDLWPRDDFASDSCPLDNRRSSKEVWMKLFVVHLTTIAAFCHVLSLHRERIWSWKLIAYLLYPSTILAKHALAIVIIVGAVVYWVLFDRTRQLGKSLLRVPRLLVAKAPVPEPDDEPEELEPVLKMGGRFLLACAFLTQCSGTLALLVRRVKRGAVTWADIRIFEVAATGVLISLYWIFIAARVPVFAKPAPTIPSEDVTTLDQLIIYVRGTTPSASASFAAHGSKWIHRALWFFGNYYLCVFTLIMKLVFVFDSPSPKMSSPETSSPAKYRIKITGSAMTMNWSGSDMSMSWNFHFPPSAPKLICWLAGGIFLFGYITTKDDANTRRRLSKKLIVARWYFILLTLVEIDLLAVLYYVWAEWFRVAQQLKELEGSPVNQACPLLWSDPASSWIWALG